MEGMKIAEKLMRIQTKIKAPKNLYNSFGKYNYRNAESICEAVKPFLDSEKCALTLMDSIEAIGCCVYIKATATLIDCESGSEIQVSAYAREAWEKKGMDDSQITGTASSYARKYALNGLFLLDDTKDADTDEYHKQTNREPEPKPEPAPKPTSKINKLMAEAFEERCKGDEALKEFIFKAYKVSSFADMTNKMAGNLNAHWDEVVAKAKG